MTTSEGMVKRPYTITKDQADALRRVHERTGIPIARLVRDGITLILNQHGEQANATVQHGGYRSKKEE